MTETPGMSVEEMRALVERWYTFTADSRELCTALLSAADRLERAEEALRAILDPIDRTKFDGDMLVVPSAYIPMVERIARSYFAGTLGEGEKD